MPDQGKCLAFSTRSPLQPASSISSEPCPARLTHLGGAANNSLVDFLPAKRGLLWENKAMLVIPGGRGKDTCDGISRRELLRIGGSALLGLSLADLLAREGNRCSAAEPSGVGGPGWGKAKSVILIYLQGGPSHLDLWDPKDNVSGQRPQRLQADRDQGPRAAGHRVVAEAGAGERQDDDDPLDELHAGRPVQPHGGHLPDADRLHGGQGQPVGPAGAADAPRISPISARNIVRLQAADDADAAVRA